MAILKPAFLGAAILALAACSAEPEPKLSTTGAWIRTPPPGAPTAAGFVTIVNAGGGDMLTGAASPIAGMVMVHRSFEDEGMAKMEHVAGLPVEAGATVKLAPGGYHIMLAQLKGPLLAGDRVPVRLSFKRSGERTVDFVVAQAPPAG